MKGLIEKNIELPSHYIPQVASVHWTSYSTTRKTLMILSMGFTHASNPLLTFSKTETSLYSMIIVRLSHRLRHLLCPWKVFHKNLAYKNQIHREWEVLQGSRNCSSISNTSVFLTLSDVPFYLWHHETNSPYHFATCSDLDLSIDIVIDISINSSSSVIMTAFSF